MRVQVMTETRTIWQASLLLCVCALISGCQPAAVSVVPSATAQELDTSQITLIPTVVVATATIEVPTFTPQPTHTATSAVTPTIPATSTPSATPSPTASVTATMTVTMLPDPVDHFWLGRPIEQAEGLTHWLDRTYPYGGTQFGTREVHLGVEFVNVRFTPVLAVADGVVLFANSDEQTLVGPVMGYYGNVVIVEHDLTAPEGGAVYTLYGHLQDLAVEIGQRVVAGDRIGRIGDSGIAIGPHLHFEVRVGSPFDYRSTRNPDLWIQPYRQYGVLAGHVSTEAGTVIQIRSERVQRETYVYGGDAVNPDPLWRENWTIGDLPVGTYEVFISDNGRRLASAFVEVAAGVTTWVALEMK